MPIQFVDHLPSRRERGQSKFARLFTDQDERTLRRTPEQWAHIPNVTQVGSIHAAATWIRNRGFTTSIRKVNGKQELFVKYVPKKG